jgi:hypothetical protein
MVHPVSVTVVFDVAEPPPSTLKMLKYTAPPLRKYHTAYSNLTINMPRLSYVPSTVTPSTDLQRCLSWCSQSVPQQCSMLLNHQCLKIQLLLLLTLQAQQDIVKSHKQHSVSYPLMLLCIIGDTHIWVPYWLAEASTNQAQQTNANDTFTVTPSTNLSLSCPS